MAAAPYRNSKVESRRHTAQMQQGALHDTSGNQPVVYSIMERQLKMHTKWLNNEAFLKSYTLPTSTGSGVALLLATSKAYRTPSSSKGVTLCPIVSRWQDWFIF